MAWQFTVFKRNQIYRCDWHHWISCLWFICFMHWQKKNQSPTCLKECFRCRNLYKLCILSYNEKFEEHHKAKSFVHHLKILYLQKTILLHSCFSKYYWIIDLSWIYWCNLQKWSGIRRSDIDDFIFLELYPRFQKI